jgi:spore coat protein U-like protein
MSISAYAATCTFTSGSANLGTPSSFVVNTTRQTATGTSGYSCTGATLTILGTNTTSGKILPNANSSGTVLRLYNATTNSYIPYTVCKGSGTGAGCAAATYNVNDTITWSSTTLLGLLGLFSGPGGGLPLIFRTEIANVPAGIYTDTLELSWTYEHCELNILNLLTCIPKTGSGTTTIVVTMDVKKACAMTDAPDINFGTAPLPSKFTNKAAQVSVRCSNQLAYNINMTSSNPVNGNWRQMSAVVNGSTYYLQYQLLNSVNAVWTHLTNHTGAGTGNVQLIDYTAAVNQAQPNLPAGVYKDTVTITLTY